MLRKDRKPAIILLVEDDLGDQELTRRALAQGKIENELRIVNDGEEALDYLFRRGQYTDRKSSPRPDLILLDLNMPRKGGRQVLQQLKRDRHLQRVPVVVLTSSMAEDDIGYCYDAGASSYIPKPATFQGWVDMITMLNKYWFELVQLPSPE